ncbi:MAG: chemotaxis protein CheD [Gemmatimonadota bacterium]
MPESIVADRSGSSATIAIDVPVAGWAVARDHGVLRSAGLGSCVAIILWDRELRLGSLAHVLLPDESLSRDRGRPTKFASTAVSFLIDEMRCAGSNGRLSARLVGGASMFGQLLRTAGVNMGERNVDAARRAIAAQGLLVDGEDVGGGSGRSVALDVATGSVTVVSMFGGARVL